MRAGAEADRVHLNDIISGAKKLEDYHILAIPGGFSFGDDIASGKVLANKMKYRLGEQITEFLESEKLIIGICNGFQAMVKMGLLPGFEGNYKKQDVTLTFNNSGKFEDRWVYLEEDPKSKCIFTKGVGRSSLPVRHGEGRFVPKDKKTLARLQEGGHVALRYIAPNGQLTEYPWNPNGSVDDIAGICDETGRVFGMMPHPEAYLIKQLNPHWTRESGLLEEGDGLKIFNNGVAYALENLI